MKRVLISSLVAISFASFAFATPHNSTEIKRTFSGGPEMANPRIAKAGAEAKEVDTSEAKAQLNPEMLNESKSSKKTTRTVRRSFSGGSSLAAVHTVPAEETL